MASLAHEEVRIAVVGIAETDRQGVAIHLGHLHGPGAIGQAHTVDEWVAIDQLHMAAEAYYQLACSFDG